RLPPWRAAASPSAASAFGGRCSRIASASSTSKTAIRVASRSGCSGVEELDILLLPGDPDRLPLAAPKRRIPLGGNLREQAVTAGHEVELHEIPEELDEDDLALGRVQPG